MNLLCLYSGGYDSTVAVELMLSLGHEVDLLFINFGQRTFEQEEIRVNKFAKKWYGNNVDCYTKTIPLPFDTFDLGDDYYIPSRNVILLSNALSYAEKYNYDGILVGFHKCNIYHSDNSPEFVDQFNEIAGNVGKVVLTPLIELDKVGVYVLGNKLGINIEDTWSCDYGTDGNYCGECRDCRFIKEGVESGVLDKNILTKMGC